MTKYMEYFQTNIYLLYIFRELEQKKKKDKYNKYIIFNSKQ